MNLNRYVLTLSCVLITIINVIYSMEEDAIIASSPEEKKHENQPRFFGGFFSRTKPQGEKIHGVGLKEHLGNVLKGGSIGFSGEISPLAPVHGFLNKAKGVISKPEIPFIPKPGFPFIPKPEMPFIPKPHPDPGPWWKEEEEVKMDNHGKDSDYDRPDIKPEPEDTNKGKPHDWESNDSGKVNTNGPRWEDIGEESDDYKDYTTIPIEDIINPRKRTRSKRRASESKVIHLPVKFVSNGKPYLARIGENAI